MKFPRGVLPDVDMIETTEDERTTRKVLVGCCIGILGSSKPDTFVSRVENTVKPLAKIDTQSKHPRRVRNKSNTYRKVYPSMKSSPDPDVEPMSLTTR